MICFENWQGREIQANGQTPKLCRAFSTKAVANLHQIGMLIKLFKSFFFIARFPLNFSIAVTHNLLGRNKYKHIYNNVLYNKHSLNSDVPAETRFYLHVII